MFIFGYPAKDKTNSLSASEKAKRFKRFIRQAKIDSLQVLHPVPIVGSDLRTRLEEEKRIFPLDLVGWDKYDGSFACFEPTDMSLEELQETPFKIMGWFYNPFSFFRIPLRTVTFPLHYLVAGWQHWYRGWMRDVVRYGGHRLIQGWEKRRKNERFLRTLQGYLKASKSREP